METLNKIQRELKAPKGQHNAFGNYNYRSCEDILEAVKPFLGKAILTLTDEIVLVGDRYYVKAQAIITDGTDVRITCAYARESLDKKGMDSAQITGAASSYARKYALNGLFCIDDTKDADATHNGNGNGECIDDKQKSQIVDMLAGKGINVEKFVKAFKIVSIDKLPKERYQEAIDAINKVVKK